MGAPEDGMKREMRLREQILQCFTTGAIYSIRELSQKLDASPRDISRELATLQRMGQIRKLGRTRYVAIQLPKIIKEGETPLVPRNIIYHDWQNIVSKLLHCHNVGLNTLLIGPAGCGKTEAIRKVAELLKKPLRILACSLRTREHHLIGRLDTDEKGNLYFKKGPLILSMEEGGICYFDELNTMEPDCLIRVDEALDHRKEINIEGRTFRAEEGWWCVASINPLDRYHLGTKLLPSQILSRFPVKLQLKYPDLSTEYEIVKMHVPAISSHSGDMMTILRIIKHFRQTDLPYLPSVRESIAAARLLASGLKRDHVIRMVLYEVYAQWGETVLQQARELIESREGPLEDWS